MSEHIEKQGLINYLEYIQQHKNPITDGFKYITIDNVIRIVSEIPTADVVERIEYKFIRHQLEETMTRVAELSTINTDLRLRIDKAIEEIEKERKWLLNAEYNAYNIDVAFNSIIHKLKQISEIQE